MNETATQKENGHLEWQRLSEEWERPYRSIRIGRRLTEEFFGSYARVGGAVCREVWVTNRDTGEQWVEFQEVLRVVSVAWGEVAA